MGRSRILGCERRRTTSYHPQANGLVERMHRQLKTALRASRRTTWTDSLPLVLLGMQCAVKTDLGCAAADLVYGTSLRLPGEFFVPPAQVVAPAQAPYAADLRRVMQQLRAVPPRVACSPSHFPRVLQAATHVFLRCDATKPPVACRYDGPFRIVAHTAKTVTLDRGSHQDVVSVDRVRSAHLDPDAPQPSSAAAPAPVPQPLPSRGPQLLIAPPSQLPAASPSRPEPALTSRPPAALPDQPPAVSFSRPQPAPAGRPPTVPAALAQEPAATPRTRDDNHSILRMRSGRSVRPPSRYRVTFLN